MVTWKDDKAAVRLADTTQSGETGKPAAPKADAPKPPAPAPPPSPKDPAALPKAAASAAAPAVKSAKAPDASPAAAPAGAAPKKGKGKDDAEPAAPAIVGEFDKGTKVGRYTIEEPIGEGGTGTVYRAFDATTNRYVAVKFLRKDQSESMRQRFLREIEVQANLRHPNLMPVFDRGEHDGRPYFAMELLYKPFTLTQIVEMGRNGTLSRYATLRPLESLETLVEDVFLPVCEALNVANVENGVVHRDLKPDNVLVDSRTLRPYVIDFGICHVLERKNKLSTTVIEPTAEEAGIVGTPRFLAPEQARGTVHERTDVWGLGAILYFCATGDAPIAAATPITRLELKRRIEALREAEKAARESGDERKAELCADKLSRLEDEGLRTLDDLFKDARDGIYSALPATVPGALSAIVRKAMAPKTIERYVNPRSMASDLEAWLAGSRTRAQAQEGTTAAGVVETATRALRRHTTAAIVGVVALGIGWWASSFFGGPSAATGGGGARPDATLATLQLLESRVDAAGKQASQMSVAEAARRYDALRAEYDDTMAQAAGGSGAEAEKVRVRAGYVLDKFAPARIKVTAPAGTGPGVLEDVLRGKHADGVEVGEIGVAPGQYRLVLGKTGGVVIPFVVPFIYREGGKPADREPVRFTVSVPIAPDAVPADWALVIPGAEVVDHRGPPFEPTLAQGAPVKPFFLARYEVSNGEWLAWLDAIPSDDERRRRTPPLDFLPDPDKPARSTLSADAKDRPVRGITPDDAVAFAKWKSSKDGVDYRLPTEAEWAVAAGAQLKFDLPGGARGSPEEGDFLEPVAVRSVKDSSPYGVKGLLGNVREIVTGVRVKSDSPESYVTKGGGAGDPPIEAAVRHVRALPRDGRDPKAGLRLARAVPPPAADAPK